jgi:hypothetical protein
MNESWSPAADQPVLCAESHPVTRGGADARARAQAQPMAVTDSYSRFQCVSVRVSG